MTTRLPSISGRMRAHIRSRSMGNTVLAVFSALVPLLDVRADEPVFTGVDVNYSLGMEKEGAVWRWGSEQEDLFQGVSRHGVRGARIRLWTGDDGPNGKAYASEAVRRSLGAGLEPYLVIFLSDDWADLMKQPAPAAWKDLDLAARADAVRAYARETVRHFRSLGLRSHLYEIGNEIDYGICGVYPGKSTKKNPDSLARSCWPDAARLIRAAEAGVREADPDAKFLLHIAHWWDPDFCIAFFRFMLAHDVQVDYAGLSYFPSSNIGGSLEMAQFGDVVTRLHRAIDRRVIVPETAYPSTSDFKGQFSRWKKAAPGYPLTPEGQKRWWNDFLTLCAHHPAIDSVYYWSPEWYGDGMWKAFALFDVDGTARPVWSAFRPERGARPALPATHVMELRDGVLLRVPVEEARRRARDVLAKELAKHGRVNTDYIKAITENKLVVDGYRVHLRASLSGNLDLSRDAVGAPCDWKAHMAATDPRSRIVLFAAQGDESLAREIEKHLQEAGRDVVVHPHAEDQPMKFGLGHPVKADAAY